MKTFANQAAQGDMLIRKVESIPARLEKQSADSSGHLVLAHSETGHNHVVLADKAELYQPSDDPFVSYMRVIAETTVKHLRNNHTHEEILLKEGLYEVRRQREYTPEGLRRAQD